MKLFHRFSCFLEPLMDSELLETWNQRWLTAGILYFSLLFEVTGAMSFLIKISSFITLQTLCEYFVLYGLYLFSENGRTI